MILHINKFRDLALNYVEKRPGKTISPQVLFEDLQKLAVVKAQLFESIRNEIFCGSIDLVVERHLFQIQHECIDLIDMIDQMKDGDDTIDELGAALTSSLEEILRLIEKRYVRFFDSGALAPLRHSQVEKEKLARQFNKLKSCLKKRNIALELQQLIVKCYSDFLNTETASYARLVYLSGLQSGIIELLGSLNVQEGDLKLFYFLIYNRFNYDPFMDYFKQMIAAKLAGMYDSREKMALLAEYEKEMIAQGEQYEKGYDHRTADAKDQILNHLKAEIRYINRQSKYDKASSPMVSGQQDSGERIRINLSVDAMMYLVRLFVEANVIISQPRSKLIAFITRHMETPGTGTKPIAVYSATKKYEHVVQSTANAARAVLIRMLKLLESQFDFKD